MKVLITGATGLIGKEITRKCHQADISVNYLTTSKDKIENKPEYKGFYWNPEQQEIDKACFNDVDAIIHLAGASIAERWTDSYKKEIISSRVDTAALLYKTLEASEIEIPHFISASAIGIYPSSLQKLYTEEDNGVDDSFLGEVVVKWEEAANLFTDLGMEVSKVRIGLVLAKDGGALQKMKEPVSLNVGTALGSGKQWQSWIHLQDLAGVFVHVLQNKLPGIYNAVAPGPVTNKELINGIAKVLGKSIWLPNVPAIALKAALGEMSAVVLSSQLVSAEKIIATGYDFQFKNLTKALEDIL